MTAKKSLFLLCFFCLIACDSFHQQEKTVKESSILLLKVNGIITNELAEDFMEYVRKYAGKDKIKGVLVRVNSPGGVVGASQEINSTIREVREFYKKPVFISGGDVVASGAVYSIVSADKIFASRGTLFGSIGVLMTFHDYSELIQWAKMDIYQLKAGEFKDSGSPFRKMTLRERELFEDLMETAIDQFKQAIVSGRKLELKAVESFADGRIFSGATALDLGLVDSLGTFNQAVRAIGEKTGLGSDPHLFDPGAKTAYERFFEGVSSKTPLLSQLFSFFKLSKQLTNRPLYILPSYISPQ